MLPVPRDSAENYATRVHECRRGASIFLLTFTRLMTAGNAKWQLAICSNFEKKKKWNSDKSHGTSEAACRVLHNVCATVTTRYFRIFRKYYSDISSRKNFRIYVFFFWRHVSNACSSCDSSLPMTLVRIRRALRIFIGFLVYTYTPCAVSALQSPVLRQCACCCSRSIARFDIVSLPVCLCVVLVAFRLTAPVPIC